MVAIVDVVSGDGMDDSSLAPRGQRHEGNVLNDGENEDRNIKSDVINFHTTASNPIEKQERCWLLE